MNNIVDDFPQGICDINNPEDVNPAIKLFGRRFIGDQPIIELLSEFFLVITSSKEIGETPFQKFLPDYCMLLNWGEYEALNYFPKSRLNLKLFAFLGSSRLETRHETHRKHCQDLWDKLKSKINTEDNEDEAQKNEAMTLLRNLFLGFWGSGASRTWCAQNFLPFCKGILSGELIWNESAANKQINLNNWDDVLDNFTKLFSQNRHRFLARGGELLYLQLCNALRQDKSQIQDWLKKSGREQYLTEEERDPERLHEALQKAFTSFFNRTPAIFNELADFIDCQLDKETSRKTDFYDGDLDDRRRVVCGWCPQESWRESYLFAVELLRLLSVNIDIMETVELLELACSMQLMRSLAAQSYRHSVKFPTSGDGLNYRIFVTDVEDVERKAKDLSKNTLNDVCLEIYNAIRIPDIWNSFDPEQRKKEYQNVDSRYGCKLFVRIGKSIGIIIPRRGPHARVVLSDKLLRFFILTLVPTKRMTLDHFKNHIKAHFGLVFDEKELLDSPNWRGKQDLLNINSSKATFLESMLESSGVLVKLSDSCSLVKNPFIEEN